MRNFITTASLVAASALAFVAPATAESIAREGITIGNLAKNAPHIVRLRADSMSVAGNAQVLEMTRLQDLKGSSPTTLRVIVRKSFQDVKAGDEFIAFLRTYNGEQLGLGAGLYFAPIAPATYGMVRVTDSNRSAFVQRVQTHATGSPEEIIHRCAADVSSPHTRLAADAVVDLWHHQSQNLTTILSSQEKLQLATAVLSAAGWTRLENERVHGVIVLGKAKASEAYDLIMARFNEALTEDLGWAIGASLVQIDKARAIQDLTAKLTGTPQQPVTPETQLRLLSAMRGAGAPEVLPAVQSLFDHADPKVRRWAIYSTAYIGADGALAALVDTLQSSNGIEAWCAAFALHRSGGTQGWNEVKRIAAIHADEATRTWLAKFVKNPAMRGADVHTKLVRGY